MQLRPPDLFSDLFAAVNEHLGVSLDEKAARFLSIRNDAVTARQEFLALKGTDFATESSIVHFLEEARDVIADYELAGFEDLYKRLLRDVLRKFNLRYRLAEPFTLRFLLPGSFNNLYAELHRINTADADLQNLLEEFEHAFDAYARNPNQANLKTCIGKASNYAEGLASATAGRPSIGNTLGALCNQLTDWPHDQVKEALQNLYKFCSDYPGIRHAGRPAGVRRNLASRDSTLASLLILGFCGYLSPQIDENIVLGV